MDCSHALVKPKPALTWFVPLGEGGGQWEVLLQAK